MKLIMPKLPCELDLSEEKIAKFADQIRKSENIQQVGLSDTEILNKIEFFRGGKVTFGAYLLFVKDYCAISDVQIGRFKSATTIIDSLSLNADLFSEVDSILAFIKKHLMVEYIITGEAQRIERFDYPLDAIREIVINMVVHRDYRDSSASIIKIFDNRIEFYNHGKLYGGITIENLLSGNYISKSRNKLIARAFKESGMIERYGSSIMRVRKICKDYGIREPNFVEVLNGFQVTIYNEKIEYAEQRIEKLDEDDFEKTTQKILQLIIDNPHISQDEMAQMIGITIDGIKWNIKKLKASGIIEHTGADKGGFWKIIKNM